MNKTVECQLANVELNILHIFIFAGHSCTSIWVFLNLHQITLKTMFKNNARQSTSLFQMKILRSQSNFTQMY